MTEPKLDRLGRALGDLLEVQHRGLAPGAPGLREYGDDPVAFSRWAGREPTDYQQAVMEAVTEHRYVAWKSGHGVGKEWTLGELAVWAAYCLSMLVLVISATERQVVGQTLREVKNAWCAHQRAGHALQGEWYAKSLRIGGEDRILGITGGASVDALTGWHDPYGVLVLVSESQAEALEESVYEAFDGVTTNANSRIVVVGNPIRPWGPFHNLFQRDTWQHFTTSVYDTPNVKMDRQTHPAFPAPDWPTTAAREHGGPESAWSRARIYGEFPESSEDSLVRVEHLNRACDPDRGARALEALVRLDPPNTQQGFVDAFGRRIVVRPSVVTVSVDPAGRGADSTAVAAVAQVHLDGQQVWLVLELARWREPDAITNAERITRLVRGLVHDERVAVRRVVVDESGLGAVLSPLKRMIPQQVLWSRVADATIHTDWSTHSPTVEAFNSSWQAASPSRFVDTRAQAYMHVADLLARGEVVFAPSLDHKLVSNLRQELLAHQTREEADGRIRVLAKNDVRAQLGRSPDLADALMMSFLGELAREKPGKPPHRRRRVTFI